MGGLWNAALVTEATRGVGSELMPVLELDLVTVAGAAAVTKRYAGSGSFSLTNGLYEPQVKQWGPIKRAIGLKEGSLQFSETQIEIIDKDDVFRGIIRGSASNKFQGSAARVYVGSPNVPVSAWWLAFGGVIHKFALADKVLSLTLRPDDSLLVRFFPVRTINLQDYPFASQSALGKYVQLIYGTHSSKGLTNTGFVPLYLVDTVSATYGGIAGRVKRVIAVYVDGVETTDFSHLTTERNGYTFTEVKLGASVVGTGGAHAAAIKNGGEATVTADIDGYEPVGDGSGAVITNPALQMEHLLANFILNRYERANWVGQAGSLLTYPPALDSASFAALGTFFTALGIKGAHYYPAEQRKGIDAIDEWADAFFVKPFLTNAGKLACRPMDHRFVRPTTDVGWIRNEDANLSEEYDPTALIRAFSVQYLYDSVSRTFQKTLDVIDYTVPASKGVVNVQHSWSPSEA